MPDSESRPRRGGEKQDIIACTSPLRALRFRQLGVPSVSYHVQRHSIRFTPLPSRLVAPPANPLL